MPPKKRISREADAKKKTTKQNTRERSKSQVKDTLASQLRKRAVVEKSSTPAPGVFLHSKTTEKETKSKESSPSKSISKKVTKKKSKTKSATELYEHIRDTKVKDVLSNPGDCSTPPPTLITPSSSGHKELFPNKITNEKSAGDTGDVIRHWPWQTQTHKPSQVVNSDGYNACVNTPTAPAHSWTKSPAKESQEVSFFTALRNHIAPPRKPKLVTTTSLPPAVEERSAEIPSLDSPFQALLPEPYVLDSRLQGDGPQNGKDSETVPKTPADRPNVLSKTPAKPPTLDPPYKSFTAFKNHISAPPRKIADTEAAQRTITSRPNVVAKPPAKPPVPESPFKTLSRDTSPNTCQIQDHQPNEPHTHLLEHECEPCVTAVKPESQNNCDNMEICKENKPSDTIEYAISLMKTRIKESNPIKTTATEDNEVRKVSATPRSNEKTRKSPGTRSPRRNKKAPSPHKINKSRSPKHKNKSRSPKIQKITDPTSPKINTPNLIKSKNNMNTAKEELQNDSTNNVNTAKDDCHNGTPNAEKLLLKVLDQLSKQEEELKFHRKWMRTLSKERQGLVDKICDKLDRQVNLLQKEHCDQQKDTPELHAIKGNVDGNDDEKNNIKRCRKRRGDEVVDDVFSRIQEALSTTTNIVLDAKKSNSPVQHNFRSGDSLTNRETPFFDTLDTVPDSYRQIPETVDVTGKTSRISTKEILTRPQNLSRKRRSRMSTCSVKDCKRSKSSDNETKRDHKPIKEAPDNATLDEIPTQNDRQLPVDFGRANHICEQLMKNCTNVVLQGEARQNDLDMLMNKSNTQENMSPSYVALNQTSNKFAQSREALNDDSYMSTLQSTGLKYTDKPLSLVSLNETIGTQKDKNIEKDTETKKIDIATPVSSVGCIAKEENKFVEKKSLTKVLSREKTDEHDLGYVGSDALSPLPASKNSESSSIGTDLPASMYDSMVFEKVPSKGSHNEWHKSKLKNCEPSSASSIVSMDEENKGVAKNDNGLLLSPCMSNVKTTCMKHDNDTPLFSDATTDAEQPVIVNEQDKCAHIINNIILYASSRKLPHPIEGDGCENSDLLDSDMHTEKSGSTVVPAHIPLPTTPQVPDLDQVPKDINHSRRISRPMTSLPFDDANNCTMGLFVQARPKSTMPIRNIKMKRVTSILKNIQKTISIISLSNERADQRTSTKDQQNENPNEKICMQKCENNDQKSGRSSVAESVASKSKTISSPKTKSLSPDKCSISSRRYSFRSSNRSSYTNSVTSSTLSYSFDREILNSLSNESVDDSFRDGFFFENMDSKSSPTSVFDDLDTTLSQSSSDGSVTLEAPSDNTSAAGAVESVIRQEPHLKPPIAEANVTEVKPQIPDPSIPPDSSDSACRPWISITEAPLSDYDGRPRQLSKGSDTNNALKLRRPTPFRKFLNMLMIMSVIVGLGLAAIAYKKDLVRILTSLHYLALVYIYGDNHITYEECVGKND